MHIGAAVMMLSADLIHLRSPIFLFICPPNRIRVILFNETSYLYHRNGALHKAVLQAVTS